MYVYVVDVHALLTLLEKVPLAPVTDGLWYRFLQPVLGIRDQGSSQ